MKQISILGCGWLGLPLAKSLMEKEFLVKGSTTSLEKLALLKNYRIDAFQIILSEQDIKGQIDLFLENSEVLIIDIPPKLRRGSTENFRQKIQNLIPFIENSSVQKVLFVSSTSVYADDNSIASDNTKPQPDTESGKQLLAVERLLQNNVNFKTTVIRFGGLIGENRHPIHFLAGKKSLPNPDAPINLIHQSDCIGIIEEIINRGFWNETLNAVAPFHPTKKEYYTQKAVELKLVVPEFEKGTLSMGKTVLSEKVENVLKYIFMPL